MEITPETPLNLPSRDSSPRTRLSFNEFSGKLPVAAKRLNAMGKSKWVPSFLKSAGARFMVMGRAKILYPRFLRAERTLSRLSFKAVSARPTMLNDGIPIDAASASTFTPIASIPSRLAVKTSANTNTLPQYNKNDLLNGSCCLFWRLYQGEFPTILFRLLLHKFQGRLC